MEAWSHSSRRPAASSPAIVSTGSRVAVKAVAPGEEARAEGVAGLAGSSVRDLWGRDEAAPSGLVQVARRLNPHGADSCRFLRAGRSSPRKGFNSPRTCSRGAARYLAPPLGDIMTATTHEAAAARAAFWPAFAALVGGALAMGVSPIFVRLADVGPFASAFYRVFLALPVLYAWMRVEEARAPRRPRTVAALHRAGRRDRPVLRLRPVLLAPRHPQHDRRQCDVLRHHGARLGGDLRLAGLSAPRVGGGAAAASASACWAASL